MANAAAVDNTPSSQAPQLPPAKVVDAPTAEDAQLLPAKSIFAVSTVADACDGGAARVGELLGVATPMFTLLTSRGMPLAVRPNILREQFEGPLLYQLPYGDLVVRQDLAQPGDSAKAAGCSGCWPYLAGQVKYCSFRNPLKHTSIHGGDAVCSVETVGGRRKVAVKDFLDLQKVMRADIIAAPGEEVTLDVTAHRRMHRAVSRSGDWLKEILAAKAQEPGLDFDWHVLASIQGAGDAGLRQKACAAASSLPVAGVWIGGLGYSESLAARSKVLEAINESLPQGLPRFLPLNCGNPIEVLQAVLSGVDILEVSFPTEAAHAGFALTFQWEMPADAAASDSSVLAFFREANPPVAVAASVRQMQLRAPEWKESFEPISENSPVRQYSRAYLHHLFQVRELLGTMLLVQHNLFVYNNFFTAIRSHIRNGTLRQFATWFLTTQTEEPPEAAPKAPSSKRRRT